MLNKAPADGFGALKPLGHRCRGLGGAIGGASRRSRLRAARCPGTRLHNRNFKKRASPVSHRDCMFHARCGPSDDLDTAISHIASPSAQACTLYVLETLSAGPGCASTPNVLHPGGPAPHQLGPSPCSRRLRGQQRQWRWWAVQQRHPAGPRACRPRGGRPASGSPRPEPQCRRER